MQRQGVHVVKVPLHGLGASETQTVVKTVGTRGVGMAFDLEVAASKVRLDLFDKRVDLGFRCLRNDR